MISMGLNLLGQAAKTALFGAVTNKVVETVITTKLNKNTEHQKWRRETKLEFFSKLSQEILSYDLDNSTAEDEKKLKEICTKTILVIDEKSLILKIEKYLELLSQTQRALIFDENNKELTRNFKDSSMNLVIALNNNLKRS